MIAEQWQPHRLTSINDYDVKVVKLSSAAFGQCSTPFDTTKMHAIPFESMGTVNTGDAGADMTSHLHEFS